MDGDHGQLLADRYRLTNLLGQGGMGAVWRAYDEQLARYVAVKELRLPDHLKAEERANWIARLDREARASARLKHPGIVTVHDRIAGADGRPWIVMEMVTGGSLDDLLHERGSLAPQHVADIGRQVAAALSAAHGMGITHRDIKPANILLEDGRAVLTDFGIAAMEGDATLTATGMIMGTPAFMAPEQVRGLPATAASDLWSLGATLYTAVEGHAPFGGSAPSAVLVAVVTEVPAPAVRAGPLAPTLNGLLRKEPAERLTMRQLQAHLVQVAPVDQAIGVPPTHSAPPADPAYSPTAPAQAPAVPVRPTPHTPPVGPAYWPTAPAQTPAQAPPQVPAVPRRPISRRTYRRIAWISASVASLVVFSILSSDESRGAEGSNYKDNLQVVEAMGSPEGFTVKSKERAYDGRARVTYVGGPFDPDEDPAGSDTQRQAASAWMTSSPGVDTTSPVIPTPTCMTETDGCNWPVTAFGGYSEPTILDAQLHSQDGKFVLQVEIGPWSSS